MIHELSDKLPLTTVTFIRVKMEFQVYFKHKLQLLNWAPRFLDREVEVAGYNIPAGTWFYASFHHFAEDKKYFPDYEVYRPERWLDPIEKKNIHPFAVIPFSHGPREDFVS